jgi:hypothetical protein
MPNPAATILLKKLEAKFTILGLKEKIFFDKPLSLKALNSAVTAALEAFLAKMKEKLEGLVDFDLDDLGNLKNFIKNDPELSRLLSGANSNLSEETLSSLLLQCDILNDSSLDDVSKETALDALQKGFLGETLDKLLDFIGNLADQFNKLMDLIGPYLGIALFLFYRGILTPILVRK